MLVGIVHAPVGVVIRSLSRKILSMRWRDCVVEVREG
jgi:hypothetical protein